MNSTANNPSVPVAVIILNWNGEKLLREFLPRVLATTNPAFARVIVADNGSTDSSRLLLENEFPEVETLYFDKNHGFADGYNLAIEHYRRYSYTVLLNSDVATRAGWIETLLSFMEAHPSCGACQPKLLSYADPSIFEYAGAAGGFIDRNGYPYCRGRVFATCESDNGQYSEPMEVDWASGAAMMVRTDAYLGCGGLDPSFFAHMEEIDLCWRMRLKGWEIWAVPEAEILHLGGGSLPPSSPRKTYLNFRNNLLMLHKNLPAGVRSHVLLRRRLLDTIAWARFVATFQWKNAAAILRAHRDFRSMRSTVADSCATANLISSRPNILLHYYVLGHKRFSRLPLNNV